MFWAQAGFSFLLWLVLGVYLSRRSPELHGKVALLSRVARGVGASALLALGLTILFGSLWLAMRMGGLGADRMPLAGWGLVTFAGFAFVTIQIFATAMLATLAREAAVTAVPIPASTSQDKHQT